MIPLVCFIGFGIEQYGELSDEGGRAITTVFKSQSNAPAALTRSFVGSAELYSFFTIRSRLLK
jgi:hypothetical protein